MHQISRGAGRAAAAAFIESQGSWEKRGRRKSRPAPAPSPPPQRRSQGGERSTALPTFRCQIKQQRGSESAQLKALISVSSIFS